MNKSPVLFPLLAVFIAFAAARAADPAAPSVQTWPKIRADRAAREVRLEATATGIRNKVPAEFFLIQRESGHGYEAIAMTDAKPSDIHRALEFIGLKPGQPVDPAAFRFRPRGPRVEMWFELPAEGNAAPRRIRAEDTILDRRTNKPLPPAGFVFTGSVRLPREGEPGVTDYAADAFEPNSIVSAFNLRSSVLDIPRTGSQGALYDFQGVNDDHVFPTNAPLTVILRPTTAKEAEFVLTVGGPAVTNAPTGAPEARLEGASLPAPVTGAAAVTATLEQIQREGTDAFVTLKFARTTPIGSLTGVPALAEGLIERHVALEPPAAGEVYFRAFAPDPEWRDRAKRPQQPWELRLRSADTGAAGTLVKITEDHDLLAGKPVLKTEEFPVATPAALREALNRHGPGLRVILVSAPASMTYGAVADFLAPVLADYPTIYLFAE